MTTSYDPATPSLRPTAPVRRAALALALVALAATVLATWLRSAPAIARPAPKTPPAKAAPAPKEPAPAATPAPPKAKTKAPAGKKTISGKLNLNTATAEQLTLLPGVGPSKAERVIAWRKKNGAFKRVADLRKVRGFGYKTIKKLEPYLDVTGATTLAAK